MYPKSNQKTGDDATILIGAFEDLEYLVEVLNGAWEAFEYRLEQTPNKKDLFMFIEDPVKEDEYECGIVENRDGKAYAFSSDVYAMIMGAYQRYTEEFGHIS